MTGLLVMLVTCAALGDLDEYGSKFEANLQNTKFDGDKLRLIGPAAGDLLKPGSEGLDAQVPVAAAKEAVGFGPRFRVSGDFSITATYSILSFSAAQNGFGIGPHIYLLTDGDESATIARLQRVKEGHVYQASYATMNESGKRQHHPRFSPAAGTSGKLRITRAGDTLHFLVADDDTNEFRELRTVRFNVHDLKMVRFGVDHDGAQGPLEVLWTNISIGADDLQGVGRVRRKVPPMWVAGGAIAAVLVGGGGAWWRVRRRRAARLTTDLHEEVAPQPTKQSATKPQRTVTTASSAAAASPAPKPPAPRAVTPGH
jgi:hypothetical protein